MVRDVVALVHANLEDYVGALANPLAAEVDLVLVHPERIAGTMAARLDADVRRIAFTKPRVRSPRNLGAMLRLRRLLRSLRPDVVHLQQTDDPWLDAALLARLPGRLVLTVHDPTPHPGDRDQAPRAAVLRARLARRSDAVIVHAEAHRAPLEAQGVDPDRIHVVPAGELGSLYRRMPHREAGPSGPTVLFFGRIWAYKGLDVLVAAMDRVRMAVPEARLVVAGRGEPIGRVFPRGVPAWCTVREGRVPDAEVAPLFDEAAVVVLPYTEASQSGVAALATGLGRPVVATRVGGLPELVADGVSGLLVPPGRPEELASAIVRVLTDASSAASLSSGALHRAATVLSQETAAAMTAAVYRAVLGRG